MNAFEIGELGLVDFHCHLDLYPNHVDLIRESQALGIRTLTVTNAPSVWPKNKELAADCKHIRVALGLHPELAVERGAEITIFEKLLDETRYVGEVGLDGSPRIESSRHIQERLFARILTMCAQKGGKILTVHSRRAAARVIEMVETYFPQDRGKVVMHWFAGTKKEAHAAEAAGCYFSVNIKMLQTRQGRELIAALPPDRILTETDGPFVQTGGRVVVPSDVTKALSELSNLWGIDKEEAALRVLKNLKHLEA